MENGGTAEKSGIDGKCGTDGKWGTAEKIGTAGKMRNSCRNGEWMEKNGNSWRNGGTTGSRQGWIKGCTAGSVGEQLQQWGNIWMGPSWVGGAQLDWGHSWIGGTQGPETAGSRRTHLDVAQLEQPHLCCGLNMDFKRGFLNVDF